MNSQQRPQIAVLGGTGHLGHALARRWALKGYEVIIGSRDEARAAEAALVIGRLPGARVRGATNVEATRAPDIVVVTVPFASQESILTEVREAARAKLIVDTTVPLVPPKVMRVQLPPDGSAALRAQRILGPEVTVVAASHNVAAHLLAQDGAVDCDVMVFGEKKQDRERVVALASDAQLRGVHGGSLANSAAAEAGVSGATEQKTGLSGELSLQQPRDCCPMDPEQLRGVGLYDILNVRANAVEFWYIDRLPDEPAAGVADLHVHPLEPRTVRVTLSKSFQR